MSCDRLALYEGPATQAAPYREVGVTPDRKKILLIDRSAGGDRLRATLLGSGYHVVAASSRDEAIDVLRNGFRPQAIVVGSQRETPLTEAVDALQAAGPSVPVLLLSDELGSADIRTLLKRPGVEAIARTRANETIDRALIGLLESASKVGSDELIVGSAAMRAIRDLVRQVADTDVPVLITGDSGVGKEVVARHLHRWSKRSAGAFVKVNCAALPDQLLESELFGYERGAFTGADRDKPGKFELANGGTILLDEIGEIAGGTQAKLLQVLQDGSYYRLGGRGEINIDARVVASTNRDLENEIFEGSFRKDLFYRLNVIRIEVPPLRERRDEILLLAQHFVRRYEREYDRRLGLLSQQTLDTLAGHEWPGNVRELQNVIRRMVVLEDVDGSIESLASRREAAVGGLDVDTLIGADGSIPPLKEVSRLAALEVEGELIRRALEKTRWNRRKAADLLHISYKALLYKIRDCGITAA